MRRVLAPAAAAALLAALPVHAQSARAAVLGDTVRVGDVVAVAVRVPLAAGETAAFPPLLPLGGADVENAASVQERHDTLADGSVQATGIYALTPWRPGTTPLPDLPVQVASADGASRTIQVRVPPLEVTSVLPAEPDALQPMPAKGVLGPNYPLWFFLLLLGAALALLGLLLWWRRRRGTAAPTVTAPLRVHPRQQALAGLHAALGAGLIERGEWKEFYTRIAHVLRVYLEAVNPGWSEDLTTTELLVRVREQAGPEHAAALAALLRPADQVKFARRVPDDAAARAEWDASLRWVESFDWPPKAQLVEVAA
jgi:hypothetical protein